MLTIMQGRNFERSKITEDERMEALSALPPDMKAAYLDVTRYHRKLLKQLAQM
jgi:hypothetical protein